MTDTMREQHLAAMRYHLAEAEQFYRYGWPEFARIEQRRAADELAKAIEHDQ